ncbi:DUF1353 domain-containing protein [Salmonella enterica]|nr:DUF1353 domain-containing protein [Salmonella enterica]EBV4143565.1 phage tail protein [Salmonella enterica subsp. enterica serovar Benin]EBE6989533.1 DUF1353 domain-containing protein [Salmonella enterica]EBE7299710.1 DUF1353 domain-containing protein [Salmonella enterica]EBW4218715.1 phage tail protein [Salmonella enterica subsp. enterica serovar Benin]
MSQFTTPVILEMLDHFLWRVYAFFEFYLSDDDSGIISVPSGFITDLASVPRIFLTLLFPDGKYAKATIIHDYLYDNALRTKKEADLIFLDGMTVLDVPKWKRIVIYLAVRFLGKGAH